MVSDMGDGEHVDVPKSNDHQKGDGSTTFVIAVPDQRGIADWSRAMSLLVDTVRSCTAQKQAPKPKVLIAASTGADLPAALHGVADVVEVDREWSPLPAEWDVPRQQAIREDKGTRIASALVAARPRGHVMVVDWDDLVSPQIGRWIAEHPDEPGWMLEAGYIFDDGPFTLRLPRGLHFICGTTLIIRADLLDIPSTMNSFDPEWIYPMYGSHRFAPTILAERGTPLAPLPFAGAAYRVGTGMNGSGRSGIATVASEVLGEQRTLRYMRPRAAMRSFRG